MYKHKTKNTAGSGLNRSNNPLYETCNCKTVFMLT